MDVSLVLDVMIALLLAVTIGYAIVLNRRLARLRDGQSEMRELVEGFNAATAQAQSNLGKMQALAKEAARGPANPNWAGVQKRLDADIKRAQELRDDLEFLLDRAERLANGLEEPLRGKRASPAASDGAPPPRSAAERELMRAVQARG